MTRKKRQANYLARQSREMMKKSKQLLADAQTDLENESDAWTKEDNKKVDAPASSGEDQNTKISKEKSMNKYKKEAHRHLVKARKLLAMAEEEVEEVEMEEDYDEDVEAMYAMDDEMDYEATEDEDGDDVEAMYAGSSMRDILSEVEDDIEDNFDGVLEEAETGVDEGGDGADPVLNVANLKEASKRLDRLASFCERKKTKKASELAFKLDKIADMVDSKIKKASK